MATCHNGYKPETVSTPKKDSPLQADRCSINAQQSPPISLTEPLCNHYRHQHVRGDAVSSQSTQSCDVTQLKNELPVDYSASLSLSSSSFMTSSLDVNDDDDTDDVTLRPRPNSGNSSFRAHSRLSAVVSQLMGLAVHDHSSGQQVTIDTNRLLRRVLSAPETAPTGSIFDLLNEMIVDYDLDTAVKLLTDAVTRARHCSAGSGSHLGRVTELLGGVELLLRLVNGVDLEIEGNCSCASKSADFDVELTSSVDCLTVDATIGRRLRHHSATDRYFRFRHATLYDDDDDSLDHHLPALSVRLSGWCLCDEQQAVSLTRLLTDTLCVCELALVKIDLEAGLMSWLADALRSNTSLIRLDLRLSSLGESGTIAVLGDVLSRHRRLRSLNLTGTGLTDTGLCALLAALSTNRKLTDLDVGFNDFTTGSGCLALADTLCSRRPPLRRLRMREGGITWSTSTVAPFFQCAARSPRIRCLDMSGNILGDDGVSQLSEAMLVNRTLRELHIEHCRFGYRGCRALARALRSNDALRSLQMSRNWAVGDAGFSEIVGALRYNRAVISLGANQCRVGNVGLGHLLDALRHNVTVTLVKLCYNDIGSDGSSPDRRRRRGKLEVVTTSCLSLQVLKDDARGDADELPASREWSSSGSSPKPFTRTRHLTSSTTRYVRSFSDVSSCLDDDITPPSLNELYVRLRQVLHDNPKLKILLWGNEIDPRILESPISRFKT